jgi:hypothetical protein
MFISRHPSPLEIMIDQIQLENVEYFKYMDNLITNEARCTHEVRSRTAITKTVFNKEEALFTIKRWT